MTSPKPSSSFIELLPAKAYIRPENQDPANAFNPETGLPTINEIQEVMSKRRSSSTSTASSMASSNEGEHGQFLSFSAAPIREESDEQ